MSPFGCLSSQIDYSVLTDALVWSYVFEDLDIQILCVLSPLVVHVHRPVRLSCALVMLYLS